MRYRFFPLHPETPDEGLSLEQLFAGRDIDIPMSQAAMAERMRAEGLPYGTRTMTYNSRLAQELAKWAETQSAGDDFLLAGYQAYFVSGRNIADPAVLAEIAELAGLAKADAQQVIEDRSFRSAVDTDWLRCRTLGLTGVPAFVAGNYGVVGAQPYEVLENLVVQAGASPRDTS